MRILICERCDQLDDPYGEPPKVKPRRCGCPHGCDELRARGLVVATRHVAARRLAREVDAADQ